MLNGSIEVVHAGFGNSIQDAGRFGFRHMGITVSGCLDVIFARCANTLVDNTPNDACIEVRAFGPSLRVSRGPVRIAVAGNMKFRVLRANGEAQDYSPWRSVTLNDNDTFESAEVDGGIAYVAIGGGIATPVQLGSRSTYQRALIGGIDGRLLANGDSLPCGRVTDRTPREQQASPWRHADGPMRVLLGPQEEHFKAESMREFLNSEYAVTSQMDRMGMRLEGPLLQHVSKAAADIVSDGITPGAIQVPGNGAPIVLLAACQTVGGYPKIATVISADLPRLAQLKPGQTIRFQAVDAQEAKAALLEREKRWRAWAESVISLQPVILGDEEENYSVVP